MLNWKTYNALPRLRSYAEALAHFNLVQPIRGDANGTKPAGRRDQKWFSIYMRDDKAVCVGGMWNRDKPLLAYYPDGRVAIEQHISAACRERIQRIAGLNIQRKSGEDWVAAAAHVDGEEVFGHYPLQLRYNSPRKAVFILHENKVPTYLNPVPVYKHVLNRKAKAEIMPRFKPFMDYVEVMAKLSVNDADISPWTKESRDNPRLPTATVEERREMGMPNRWTPEWQLGFISLIESGETENWYKAMTWLSAGHWRLLLDEAKLTVMHMVHKEYRDVLFTKVRADAGKLVYDRYATYFR
jgi:hypothetical protein